MVQPFIVGIGGTTRSGSSSERLTIAVLQETERLGARTLMFGGAKLAALPHFAPESPERTAEQLELITAVRAADGLVIGTPGYHAGISGLVKNAIDLLEDTRQDKRVYFDHLPVGVVVSAAGWQAIGHTLGAMRAVIAAMRGWATPIGVTANTVAQTVFNREGEIADADIARAVAGQALQIMRHATSNTHHAEQANRNHLENSHAV
jgi:FMN reductase